MIGFCVYKGNEYQLVDILSVFSYGNRVPFCSFEIDSMIFFRDMGVLPARLWNGDSYEQVELTEFPAIIDSYYPLGVIEKQCPEKKDLIDIIRSKATVLTQRSLHKDELAVALMRSDLNRYAIPTYQITSYNDLTTYVKLFKTAIMKPSHGRQGGGVILLRYEQSGVIYVVGNHECTPFDEKKFLQYLNNTASVRNGNCLIQPYLNFRLPDDRAYDFRLLCHRGTTGTWENVASYARIGSNPVTSNLAQGGYIAQMHEVLQQVAGDKWKEVYSEIEMLGKTVPALIEKYRGNDAICIGIDIGVDRSTLHPYVMETNALPGTKFHLYQFAEKRVQYYKYLLSKEIR